MCFPESGLQQFLGDRDMQAPWVWSKNISLFFKKKRGYAEECLLNNCQAIAASISFNSWWYPTHPSIFPRFWIHTYRQADKQRERERNTQAHLHRHTYTYTYKETHKQISADSDTQTHTHTPNTVQYKTEINIFSLNSKGNTNAHMEL